MNSTVLAVIKWRDLGFLLPEKAQQGLGANLISPSRNNI